MIRLAILNSNFVSVNRNTKKGTEIFDYLLISQLARQAHRFNLKITAFGSGDSNLPVNVESVNFKSSMADSEIGLKRHQAFELALISKAISMQDQFDVIHLNIGNGDTILPFVPFIKKPIIITLHGSFLEELYNKKYLSLFKNLKNIYFVSISDVQREPAPDLNYVANIYHGIEIRRAWKFSPKGGDHIIWAGRAVQEKGITDLIKVLKRAKRPAHIFPMIKDDTPRWMNRLTEGLGKHIPMLIINKPLSRRHLAAEFQNSKLFLFPVQWEEPFGLVLIEAMASGTPVVGYARGSVPEIVEDGVTGFVVNPSADEIKGDFAIKKHGVDGLCEAIDRIYNMPDDEYRKMRENCRARVEKYFTVQRMVRAYIDTYKKAIALTKNQK